MNGYCTVMASRRTTLGGWRRLITRVAVFIGRPWPNHLNHHPGHLSFQLSSSNAFPMSLTNNTAEPSRSNDNFAAIFQAALSEYETLTGKPLHTHPFAAQFDSCDNPEAISDVLRSQAQAFNKFRKADEKLMTYLDPTVHVLFTFSATLGEGIGLVSRFIHPI
jgi:fungal STAND N-terminal Goodbye domain